MKIYKNSRDSEDKSRIFDIYITGFPETKHKDNAGKKVKTEIIIKNTLMSKRHQRW